MNDIRKKAWRKAALGFLLGLAIGVVLLTLLGSFGSFMGARGAWANAAYLLYCGVYGAACMGGQVIYEIERWSLARATLTHFLIVTGGFYILGFLLGWRPDDPVIWIISAVFLAIYVLIWLVNYLAWKREVRKMNEDLEKWKSTRRAD